MKQLIMIGFLLAAESAAFAQKDHRVYEFNHSTSAKDVHQYGAAPEFPFLRNLATEEQFVAALRAPHGRSTAHLNSILQGLGFARGAQDVTTSSVERAYIAEGRVGNMGDAGHNYVYAKLYADGNGVKAWKVTADNGASVYFISKCGNTFYPDPSVGAASAYVPEEVILPVAAEIARPVCKDKVYIYYGGTKKISRGWEVYADDMETEKCSEPYNKTAMVRAQEEPAKAYTDIHVETTAEYLGYRKVDNGEYMTEKQWRKSQRGCGCNRCNK